ncbi:Dipeptidyl-peptidase-like protein 2 [Elsinoe fawcettii]|nr:Dipeptidyl-peptidase-like protein 2 [Elsinoe fawcettii]
MTVRTRLTPSTLLSAPRRSPAIPNPSGTHALHSTSTYSFTTHSKTTELRLLSTASNESVLLSVDAAFSSPVWLDDASFLLLRSDSKANVTEILFVPVEEFGVRYVVGTIPSPAENLKIARLDDGGIAVVVSALQDREGAFWAGEKRETYSSGRLYKGLYVRHWDAWEGDGWNALWYAVAKKEEEGQKWKLNGEWRNLLKGRKGLESPVRPFGGTDHFDVSRTGIVFVSKDPARDPGLNTTCGVYLAGLKSFEEEAKDVRLERMDDFPGFEGAAGSPVFTPNGEGLAFLKMKINGYESDRNTIWVALDVHTDKREVKAAIGTETTKVWDRSPSSLAWSLDGQTLYLVAEEKGYNKLFYLPLNKNISGAPLALTEKGSVSSAVPLKDGSVFLSTTSLVDNSTYSIVKPPKSEGATTTTTWTHSITKAGSALGLSESQVSTIWTPAANPDINEKVHSFVFRPSFYDKSKKYPLAFLIHGGPQGAWGDAWSTRWNPAVFAEQGYIVVSPNPTGSTGYGQAFTDAIRGQWGGDPYRDLENVFEYIERELPDVDTSNAVALGASYGGYMINWLNGHPLGRKFKALVNHDGIFSVNGLLATEELYFPFYDLGGLPFYSPDSTTTTSSQEAQAQKTFGKTDLKTWLANDPSQHLDKWETPQLVIHSTKDYRLCISEGLSVFNVLQARGIESQFLTFPDENHWVLKPENSLLWHKVVLNWINKFTGLPQIADEEAEGADFYGGIVQKEGQKEGEQELIAFGNPTT